MKVSIVRVILVVLVSSPSVVLSVLFPFAQGLHLNRREGVRVVSLMLANLLLVVLLLLLLITLSDIPPAISSA